MCYIFFIYFYGMKKLIDISEEYLAPLKRLSKSRNRSVKKQLETIIYDEILEVVAGRDPDIINLRDEVIESIHKVFSDNGDLDKELKFICFCDHIAQYKLNTKEHSYIIDVDNNTILPKSKIGHIVFKNSFTETHIEFTCKDKKTGREIGIVHAGHNLAHSKLEKNGLIID